MDRTLQDLLREKTREFRDMAIGDAAHADETNSGLLEIFTPDPFDTRRYRRWPVLANIGEYRLGFSTRLTIEKVAKAGRFSITANQEPAG